MSIMDVTTGRHLAQVVGEVTYTKNGVTHRGEKVASILVSSESDLSLYSEYPRGTIAHTPGYANIWEKNIGTGWTPFEI